MIAFAEDVFVLLRDCRAEQEMVPGSKLEVLDSLWGHFTTLGLFEDDFKRMNAILGDLLAN